MVGGIFGIGKKIISTAAKKSIRHKLGTQTPSTHTPQTPEIQPSNHNHSETPDTAPPPQTLSSHQIPEHLPLEHPNHVLKDTPESLERYGIHPEKAQLLIDSGTITRIKDTDTITITQRLAQLDELGIPYRDMTHNAVLKRGITEFQAQLMLMYTDLIFSLNLNDLMRHPHKIKTPEQKNAILTLQHELTA